MIDGFDDITVGIFLSFKSFFKFNNIMHHIRIKEKNFKRW